MKENYFETLSDEIVHEATIECNSPPYILNKGRYHKIRVTGYNTLPHFKIQDMETYEDISGSFYMIDREGSDFIIHIDLGSELKVGISFYDDPSKKEEKKDYLEDQIGRILDYDSGVKHDSDKLPYEFDWGFIRGLAERMALNKDKYPPYNWKKPLDKERIKQALFRHVMEVMSDNMSDEGRDLGHLEAIALNSMFLYYHESNR